jgi:hypothetical protein
LDFDVMTKEDQRGNNKEVGNPDNTTPTDPTSISSILSEEQLEKVGKIEFRETQLYEGTDFGVFRQTLINSLGRIKGAKAIIPPLGPALNFELSESDSDALFSLIQAACSDTLARTLDQKSVNWTESSKGVKAYQYLYNEYGRGDIGTVVMTVRAYRANGSWKPELTSSTGDNSKSFEEWFRKQETYVSQLSNYGITFPDWLFALDTMASLPATVLAQVTLPDHISKLSAQSVFHQIRLALIQAGEYHPTTAGLVAAPLPKKSGGSCRFCKTIGRNNYAGHNDSTCFLRTSLEKHPNIIDELKQAIGSSRNSSSSSGNTAIFSGPSPTPQANDAVTIPIANVHSSF